MSTVVPPVDVHPFEGITADQASALPADDNLVLRGFACRESAGSAAAATFRLLHGSTLLIPVELAANESKGPFWFGEEGIPIPSGLTIDWIAGTIDVVLFSTIYT